MNLTIEMDNPEQKIMEELTDPLYRGTTQASVAITYAFLIAQQPNTTDWRAVNHAIIGRWKGKNALTRVKTLAWKQMDEWVKRGAA